MSGVQILVRHDAELDAYAYFQRISERNPEVGLNFLRAIDETVEDLALQPLKGRPRRFRGKDLSNIRSGRVNGSETYLLFYRFSAGTLEILRLRHGAMKLPRALRKG